VTGTPPPSGIQCPRDEFTCNSKDQCVARSLVCDGKYDCNDYSDETNSDCRKFFACYIFFSDTHLRKHDFSAFERHQHFLTLFSFTTQNLLINLKTGDRARNGSSAAKTARAFPSRRNVTIKSIVPIPVTNWTVSVTPPINPGSAVINFICQLILMYHSRVWRRMGYWLCFSTGLVVKIHFLFYNFG
jgi:Low-density lipoprotein receptor domain class A